MVTSVKGHQVNLDTFNATACFDEIQRLQKAGGIVNGLRASAKAVELPWHSLRDAFSHGCELVTGIPQAYRDGQLKKHSWHFMRAVTSGTYAAVALPLAFTPEWSLKVADSLHLRESWETKVSTGVVARVKDTVVAMSKGPKAKSLLKIGVGLAAFGALAYIAGSFSTPTVPDVPPPPLPPPPFGGYSIPNFGDLNFNPFEVTSQASKSLDPLKTIGTIGAVAGGAIGLYLLLSCTCGSKKPKKVENDDAPEVQAQVLDVANAENEVPEELVIEEVQPEPEVTERTIKIGNESYPILSDGTVRAKFDQIFDVSGPSEKYKCISINGKPVPLINSERQPWKEGDGLAWFAESYTDLDEPVWKQLSGTGPNDLFITSHTTVGKLDQYVPLNKTVTIGDENYQVVATLTGKRYAYQEGWGAVYEVTYAKDVHWISVGNDLYPVVKGDNDQWFAQVNEQLVNVYLDDQDHFRMLFPRL